MEDLWDDSALIKAFNNAITKYKDMHGLKNNVTAPSEKVSEAASDRGDKFNGVKGDVSSFASNSHVLEPNYESKQEKADIHDNAESCHDASKEDLQQVPMNEDPGTHSLNEDLTMKTSSWTEYEQQQIMEQLQQITAQRQNLEKRLNNLKSNNAEEATTNATYNGYAGSEYYTQHSYPYTASCYQCQWNAYYNSSNAWASSTSSQPNDLQCQHCGCMNKYQEAPSKPTRNSEKEIDASAFSAVVKEAMMAAEAHRKDGSQQSEFSDVAVAWFLAGYHTSRYLSKGSDPPQ